MAFWKRKDTVLDTTCPECEAVSQQDPEWKSREFEQYAANLFGKQHFAVASHIRGKESRYSAAGGFGTEPNMKVQYRPTGEEFFVECRYWVKLGADRKLNWAGEAELKDYFRYSKQHPVFLVVGLGGRPASPAKMFCIPLKEARWTELFPNVYTKFERPPGRTFFWKNGDLV